MSTLIDRQRLREDLWERLDSDQGAPRPTASHVVLSWGQWADHAAPLLERGAHLGVALAPADDPACLLEVLPSLSLITIDFPAFTDGRGYSQARLLRDRYGWNGELRATGDIGRDQLFYLARVGFDSFVLREGEDPHAALASFGDFSEAYQGSHDRGPLFERRAAQVQP